jgi:extracellular elastinolytic metalloproteinase
LPPAAATRALASALAVAAPILAAAPIARAHTDGPAPTVDRTEQLRGSPPAALERAQKRLRDDLGALALVEPDPTAATPRIVARLDADLTGPSRRDPEAIALDYVREHLGAFGLDAADLATLRRTARRYGAGGSVHMVWEQRAGGLPNVDGGLQATVAADGSLINVRGGPLPDPGAAELTPRIAPEAAYEAAQPGDRAAPPAGAAHGAERRTPFLGGGSASLVLYRDGGTDRLGWRLLVPGGADAFYDAVVDADTGRLQRRVNRTKSAVINHYDVNPRAPGENGTTFSTVPGHWLAPGQERLYGPYVHAISDLPHTLDLNGSGTFTRQPTFQDEVPPGTDPDVWDYDPLVGPGGGFCPACTWGPSVGGGVDERTRNRAFSTAQLFWYVNKFRDHLAGAPIGFTGSGEFKDGDRIVAQALDGAGTTGPNGEPLYLSNANMTVWPDGIAPSMQLYLFRDTTTGRYDGAMDASLVYHEAAHGLSERLVTNSQGYGALNAAQSWSLAEGNSDFYALDFLADPASGPVRDTAAQGEIRFANWLQLDPARKGLGAFRTEGLDCSVTSPDPARCPGTAGAGAGGYDYGDFARVAGRPEVHADGEIWAQTLWSMRDELIAAYGGSEGVRRARAYVTEGLRMAPPEPSFLDMRNAILQAAQALNPDQDWNRLWAVFAARGMGWSASTDGPDDTSPQPAGDLPPPPPPPTGPSGAPVVKPAFAVSTAFRVRRLIATRKGVFKVKVRFGSAAPAGRARLRVLLGKKLLAQGRLRVRRLRTSTKTLRLNAAGRKRIRPGKSRRVRLELKLPGGQKVKKTVRLTRKRR